MIEIPEWSKAVEAFESGTASPLDLFVYHNEPAGNPQDVEFRNQLQALLDYVSGLTQLAPDKWESPDSTGVVLPLKWDTSQEESTPPTCG